MSWLMLSDVARMLDAEMHGPDVALEQVSADTRNLLPGSLFIALAGPNFDAHDLLDRQPALDLSGMVLSRPVAHPASYVLVPDTRDALARLARAWRQQLDLTLIGLTGSNGKTTVKEMIAAICAGEAPTLATRGNLNNEIGVPLTLLELRPWHRYAVIEMGASRPGDIGFLTDLARPDVVLLINAGNAHLEGFGSIEAVAAAKAEIFAGLGPDGVAVINADSPFAEQWRRQTAGRRRITFGEHERADCRVAAEDPMRLELHGRAVQPSLRLLGRHNLLNAAAAAAAASAAGIATDAIVQGLEQVAPVAGRLCPLAGPCGSTIIDDSYNANPGSVAAAIEVLAGRRGRRCLVLGDMAELGPEAATMHAAIGSLARERGIDELLTLGPLSAEAARAFGAGAESFADHAALAERLATLLGGDTTVLVKGSRSAAMERVVDALLNRRAEEGASHAA